MSEPLPIAVVTGASGGIGGAIARAIDQKSEHGLRLALHCHGNAPAAVALSETIPDSFVVQADLSTQAGRDHLLQSVLAEGPPYVLVNNAGARHPSQPALSIEEEAFDFLIGVNLKAPLFLMEAFGKAMAREGAGVIVNVSSVLAHKSFVGSAVYRATKSALEALTCQYAHELAPRGVRVNAVAPGLIQTAMTDEMTDEMRARAIGWIALGAAGSPEMVASAVWQLIENEYLTGVILPVNGGIDL